MPNAFVAGVDLSAAPAKPSFICVLKGGRFHQLPEGRSDEEIVRAIDETSPDLVAVDAPLTAPDGRAGTYAYRKAEREVRAAGIPIHAPAFLGALTFRGMALARKLSPIPVIETYPYGALLRLSSVPAGKKTDPEEHARRVAFLREQVQGLPALATDHEVDAVVCALAAHLHLLDRTEAFGDPEEGRIWLPSGGTTKPGE